MVTALHAAFIVAAGPGDAGFPSRGSVYPPSVDGSVLPIKQAGRVLIDTSNRYRLVEGKCKAARIPELLTLLTASGLEAMWTFVTARRNSSRCTGYELGREVTAAGRKAKVRVARDSLTSLMRQAVSTDTTAWHFDQERTGTGRLPNRVATHYELVGYVLTQVGKEKFADDRRRRTAAFTSTWSPPMRALMKI